MKWSCNDGWWICVRRKTEYSQGNGLSCGLFTFYEDYSGEVATDFS